MPRARLRALSLAILLSLAAGGAGGAPLRKADLPLSELECLFAVDCSAAPEADTSALFEIGTGEAILHARTLPAGEKGTPGEAVRAYLYRLDLRGLSRLASPACVTRLTLEFGPIESLDYDGDGEQESVLVVGRGSPGSVGPSAAEATGDALLFHFARAICAGESSRFFGAASGRSPVPSRALIRDSAGARHVLETRTPGTGPVRPWWKSWQVWLVLAAVSLAALLTLHRRR